MNYAFEPFVLDRLANNRIFVVSPKMPFGMFVDCFYIERPFFLVSRLDDRRIAVTPNTTVVPLSLFQAGHWPRDLFPTEWEYGTIKSGTYPVIVTAHPITNFDVWCKQFEKNVIRFAEETLAEYVTGTKVVLPLEYEQYEKGSKPFSKEPVKV